MKFNMSQNQFDAFRAKALDIPQMSTAGGSGSGSTIAPDGSHIIDSPYQQYQTMQINLLTYPRSSTGLDSANRYQAYMYNSQLNPSAIKVEVRVQQGNEPYKTGDTILGFCIGVSNGCPDPQDNGFYIFVPISVAGGNKAYGGMYMDGPWVPASSGSSIQNLQFAWSDDYTNGFTYLDSSFNPITPAGSPPIAANPMYMQVQQPGIYLIIAFLHWIPTTLAYSSYAPYPQIAIGGEYGSGIWSVGSLTTEEYGLCGSTSIGYYLEPILQTTYGPISPGDYVTLTSSSWQMEAIEAYQSGAYIFKCNLNDKITIVTANSGNYINQSEVQCGWVTAVQIA